MIATATFFGFADLDAFSAAVLKLGGGGGGKGGGEGEGGAGFRRVPSSIVPGVASVRDAATSLRVARRVARLRAAVDAELRAKDAAAIDVDSPVDRASSASRRSSSSPPRRPSAGSTRARTASPSRRRCGLRRSSPTSTTTATASSGPKSSGGFCASSTAWRGRRTTRGGGGGFAEPMIRPSIRPSTSFDSSDVDFVDPAEVSAAFDALDGDGDGRVSLEEFVAWVSVGDAPSRRTPTSSRASSGRSARDAGRGGGGRGHRGLKETPPEEAAIGVKKLTTSI